MYDAYLYLATEYAATLESSNDVFKSFINELVQLELVEPTYTKSSKRSKSKESPSFPPLYNDPPSSSIVGYSSNSAEHPLDGGSLSLHHSMSEITGSGGIVSGHDLYASAIDGPGYHMRHLDRGGYPMQNSDVPSQDQMYPPAYYDPSNGADGSRPPYLIPTAALRSDDRGALVQSQLRQHWVPSTQPQVPGEYQSGQWQYYAQGGQNPYYCDPYQE